MKSYRILCIGLCTGRKGGDDEVWRMVLCVVYGVYYSGVKGDVKTFLRGVACERWMRLIFF